jgi:Chromo (CHRromatin Organisation MOdifier) domain
LKKLSEKQYGPFKVLEKIREASYRLKLPESWKLIHDVFHESLLTPHHTAKFQSQCHTTPLLPEMVGDDLEYEVEAILDSRIRKQRSKRQMEYLISWKGYGSKENSWLLKKNLLHSNELIREFHDKYKDKPKL